MPPETLQGMSRDSSASSIGPVSVLVRTRIPNSWYFRRSRMQSVPIVSAIISASARSSSGR